MSVIVHILDSLVQFLHSIAVLSKNKDFSEKIPSLRVVQSESSLKFFSKFSFLSFALIVPRNKVKLGNYCYSGEGPPYPFREKSASSYLINGVINLFY